MGTDDIGELGKIRRGTPVPPSKQGSPGETKYPWPRMRPGDDVRIKKPKGETMTTWRSRITSSIRQYCAMENRRNGWVDNIRKEWRPIDWESGEEPDAPPIWYVTRREDDEDGAPGVRVWLLEADRAPHVDPEDVEDLSEGWKPSGAISGKRRS